MNLATIVNHNALSWQHIAVGLLIALAGIIAFNLPYLKRKGPEKTCQATVIGKRIGQSNTPQVYYRGSRWDNLINFRCEDGTTVELYTTAQVFSQLKEGLTGTLKYRGEQMIEFEWETEDI